MARTGYFDTYNRQRPNLVIRLGSNETKERLMTLARASGVTLSELVVASLADRLMEEELADENLD